MKSKAIYILPVILFLAYPFEVFQLFAVGSYGVKVVDFFLVVFYMIFLKRFIWNGNQLQVSMRPYIQLFLVFLLSVLVSGIFPLASGRGIAIVQYFKTFSHFMYILIFVFITVSYPFKSTDWSRIIKVMLIYSMLLNMFGIYQLFARALDLPYAWLSINNVSFASRGDTDMNSVQQLSIQFMNLFRATSVFSEPSMLAAFNSMMLLFQIVPFIQRRKQYVKNKWLSMGIFASLLMGTFATFSLTAALALFGVLGALLIFEKRYYLKKAMVGFVAALIFIFIVDSFVEKYTETSVVGLFSNRITGVITGTKDPNKQIAGESFSFRTEIVMTSIEVWQKSPIIGCGLGNFALNQDRDIYFAQDLFFGSLSELGLIGNISVIAFFGSMFFSIYVIHKNKLMDNLDDDLQRLFGLIPYIVLQLALVNFLTTNYLIYVHLWFYVAIVLSTLNIIFIKNNVQIFTITFSKNPLRDKVIKALNKLSN